MAPKLPGLLVRYIQQKRCVVFVGAGLSAGAGLPTWGPLLRRGIDELVGSLPEGESHQEELRSLVDRGKLLEVADFCKEKLGAAYHQFLTEQVRGDEAEVPRTHEVLMHLPFSAWVTTNYDKLLERAYSKIKGGFPKTLTHKDTEPLGRLLFDGGQFILKAHGDIDRPETVVLTSRDYSEIIHANPAFNEVFSGLLLTKALFFVGYSLSDPDFRLLMDRQLTHFKGFVPERFALMTDVGPVERDVLWRTARIQIISYESGKHEQVLHFLEALKAAVLPEPVSEPGHVRAHVPASGNVIAQPGQVRSHNLSSPGRPEPRVPQAWIQDVPPPAARAPIPASVKTSAAPEGASASFLPLAAGLDDESADSSEERMKSPFSSMARPMPPPASQASAPAPQLASTGPDVLGIDRFVSGMVRFRLTRQGEELAEGIAPTKLNQDVSLSLQRAIQAGGGTQLPAWLYADLTRHFTKHRPQKVFEALEESGSSPREPLVLRVATRLSRFPWELLPIQDQPMCLQRKLVRAPVGVPAQVRGAPQVRSSPRILLVEGLGGVRGGGTPEIERLAGQYQRAQGFSCTVLQGADATFARVMAELDAALPDLLHYTGGVGQVDGELFLRLPGDMDLSAGALRSVLSRGRLPFLVMNAPSSAFAPPVLGLYPVGERYQRMPVPSSSNSIFEGHEGFMDLATQAGVGAFVGSFDMPGAQAGTAFMAALHYALLTGLPIADAVFRARQETQKKFPDDPTALQYVLSGDGSLQLWDSRREEGQD